MDDPRHPEPQGTTRGALLAVVVALVAIGAATLTPQDPGTWTAPWYLPFSNPGDGADALLNVGLFVPLGIALAFAGQPRRRSAWVAVAVTVTVELLQGFVVPGRQASVGDVLTNSVGGWIGHLLAPALVAGWRVEGRLARRLAAGYGVLWLVGTVAAAALLRPALPAGEVEAARCGPERNVPDCFPGRLTAPLRLREPGRPDVAIVPGVRLSVGREASILAEVIDGGYARRPGRLGGVTAPRGGALMTLEQGEHWLVLAVRTRGANWGLRAPAVALPGVFGRRGTHLVAEGGVTGNVRWLGVGTRRVELRLSAADGWRLFFPWSVPRLATLRAVGALFHAIALLPLAFWVARGVVTTGGGRTPLPTVASMGAVLAAMAIAFAGAALALDLAAPSPADWLGGIGGAAAGALLAGRPRR